jgi:hypothetical protein
MIVWDASDCWAPCVKHGRCVICRGRLRFPFVLWHAFAPDRYDNPEDDGTRFICDECCDSMCRGFSIDMKQIATAKKVEQLGFRVGRQAAVSGGFLYTTGMGNKQ